MTIPQLTPGELDVLQLGFLVRQDLREDEMDAGGVGGSNGRRKHSSPRRTTDEALRDFEQTHLQN